jgi:hypothetical protein
MPSRTVFAPEVITRQPTQPGEWPLRFELVEKRFYRVRAPLGAQVELKDYQKLILQDSLKGTPPEETAATYSKMAGEELTPASLKSPLRAVIRRTRSRTVFEAACKAVVLGSVNLNLEVDV